jgi:uncharacterized membrane protein
VTPDTSSEGLPDRASGERAQSALRRSYRTNRVEAFSDGVFAIAITLLVLEIAVPAASEQDLAAAMVALLPSLLGYVVSFATIGAAWLAHAALTEYLDRVDAVFVRVNLLLLMVIALIPFSTRLLAEHAGTVEGARFAVTLYGINLMLASVLNSILWRYAARARLVKPDADDEEVRLLSSRLLPGVGFYAVMIVVGLIWPQVAVVGYLVIAVFFLIPFPIRRRRRGSRPGPS